MTLRGACERPPLVDEELRAPAAGQVLGEPAGACQGCVPAALDPPPGSADERDKIARRQPAEVCLVAVTRFGVSERPLEDEVANE